MNKFGTGSLATLSNPNIRDDLLKFYNTFYSANLMKCVLYSEKSIEYLEELAKKSFGPIPSNNQPRVEYKEMPYDKENLGVLVKYFPV